MALSADDLIARLSRGEPEAAYFLHGDEPLQLGECADAVRACARVAGAEERIVFDADTGIDWQAVRGESQAMSLFASRRLVEIRLGTRKPDKAGAAVLADLLAGPAGEDILLVTAGKLDRRTLGSAWCKALEKGAVTAVARELKPAALPGWLVRRAKRQGKALSMSAAAFVADRVEGNMLAAAQEIEKLCLLIDAPRIDEDDVARAVLDSARFDVFQLVDAVLAGDLTRAIRVVRGLREEGTEPVLVNWALGRELRQLARMAEDCALGQPRQAVMERHRVWSSRRGLVERVLTRSSADDLSALLAYANHIDTVVKGARPGNPWDAVELLILNAGGARAYRAMLRTD